MKNSFAYCAAALEGIDNQKVLAYSLPHIVGHNNEIYGNIVWCLRQPARIRAPFVEHLRPAARANAQGLIGWPGAL